MDATAFDGSIEEEGRAMRHPHRDVRRFIALMPPQRTDEIFKDGFDG